MRKETERGSKDEGSPPSSEPDGGGEARGGEKFIPSVRFRLPRFSVR